MAFGESAGPAMSDAEYRMFCELLRDYCGLRFVAESRLLVSGRLARRIEELGLDSFRAYHFRLLHGPDADEELARVIDLVTTNETYFFREPVRFALASGGWLLGVYRPAPLESGLPTRPWWRARACSTELGAPARGSS